MFFPSPNSVATLSSSYGKCYSPVFNRGGIICVRPIPCKIPYRMALVNCPCAFRLRRLAKNAGRGISVQHFPYTFPQRNLEAYTCCDLCHSTTVYPFKSAPCSLVKPRNDSKASSFTGKAMALSQNPGTLVNPKIAGIYGCSSDQNMGFHRVLICTQLYFCNLKDSVLVTPPVSKHCVRAGGEPNSSFDLETTSSSIPEQFNGCGASIHIEPCDQTSI